MHSAYGIRHQKDPEEEGVDKIWKEGGKQYSRIQTIPTPNF